MEQSDQKPFEGAKNPCEHASIFSKLSFWYTRDLFYKGFNTVLQQNDLYRPLKSDESEVLGDRLEKNWAKQIDGKTKPSLIKAIIFTFWKEYLILGCLQFFNDIFIRLSQPMFLGLLLSYFTPDSKVTKEEAFFHATAVIVLNSIASITTNQFIFRAFNNGMKVRVATCSLIYRKSLRLSSTALGNTSVGKVVNLISNDVSRFDVCSFFIHSMWLAPLLTAIVAILLYREVGYAGLFGIIVILVVTPLQSYTGKLSSKFRLQTALRTDERVRLMDEVVSGIQVIKLYAWEKPFKKLVHLARNKELRVIRNSSYVRAIYMTFMLFTTRCALFCTMMAIVLLGEDLTASKVFVISLYFGIMSMVMSQMFVRGIAEIAESLVSMARLQKFLDYEEQIMTEMQKENLFMKFDRKGEAIEHDKLINSETQISQPNVVLSMKNLSCRWKTVEESIKLTDKQNKKNNAKNGHNIPKLSTNANKFDENDELKLTLNNISLELNRGILMGIVGSVGSGKSSLLQAILHELPTESGSLIVKGSVSFASQEPWVFSGSIRQNILFGSSNFDQKRYDEVIEACALKRDFDSFEFGDETLIGERGSSLSGGQKARVSLARALYRKADLYLLDDPLSALDSHVGKHVFDQCFSKKGFLGRQKAARILVTHQVHFLNKADWIVILKDGIIEKQGLSEDLANSGIDIMKLVEETEDKKRSISRSSSASSSKSNIKNNIENKFGTKNEQNKNIEESSKGKIPGNIVVNYFKNGGGSCSTLIVVTLFILTQTIASTSDYWVGYWTKLEEFRKFSETLLSGNLTTIEIENISNTPDSNLVYIGGALIISLFIFAIIRSIFFYTITVSASRNLHAVAFNGVVSTKMRFFDVNPSGRILNRFSKDFGQIDEWLPKSLLDASQVLLTSIGSIVVTALVNPLVLIPICFLGIFFRFIQKYYLKTSKNIKRIEGISKSHAFVHLAATINGLATIRAFKAQKILAREFDHHQNTHTGVFYSFLSCSQAFGFALDILCMLFVFFVIFSFLLFEAKEFNGSSVGLAITQSMALTAWLQWGVRQSAEVMNQMMSVERVLEYRELEPEESELKKPVDKNWPQTGKISFKNVVYKYGDDMEPVLKGLNFNVKSCEKIGIVGRTGAGKSSLIGSLFRIAIIEGEIEIDGIETSSISLEQLRSKISIIPQDPGSMRKNLDPFEEYSDDALWKSLEEVKLKDCSALKSMGLQTLVAAGGSNFSVGQRQLICLARAILRNNKILVLDEATANVDPETDKLIQDTIKKKFNNCTVMTIAHRLHTVMDSDKILVMNFGKVAEFDSPLKLLNNSDGIFSSMVKATGAAESFELFEMAKKKK